MTDKVKIKTVYQTTDCNRFDTPKEAEDWQEVMDDTNRLSTELRKADNLIANVHVILNMIGSVLSCHLKEQVSVTYQAGDGWVIVWGDGKNSHISPKDLDSIIKLDTSSAWTFIQSKIV